MSKLKSSRWRRPLQFVMLSVLLIVVPVALTGCQTTGSVAIKPVAYCTIFKPIYWSKSDTLETAKQIREHNAVWKEMCGGSSEVVHPGK